MASQTLTPPPPRPPASVAPVAPRGRRRFELGSGGWSIDSFDDPSFERFWAGGDYEILDGRLTRKMAANQDGTVGLGELVYLVLHHARSSAGERWTAAPEADVAVSPTRVVKGDLALLSPVDQARQRAARAERDLRPGRRPGRGHPLYVPPTVVVESVSAGHEAHDRLTKRAWYAEFGVPHYWVLDALRRRLECLTLEGGAYVVAASGTDRDEVRPPVPAGLVIPLADLWVDG